MNTLQKFSLYCVACFIASGSSAIADEVCYSSTPWCKELLRLCAMNGCAGNLGDWYDNRDGWHTDLYNREQDHPQVQVMQTGRGAQLLPANDPLLSGKVVIGNASVAHTAGYNWGSVVRVDYMSTPLRVLLSYEHYTNNIAYWFPCHLDHPEYRDFYHALLPKVTSSQGSSGSEISEIKKWFFALAAFQPEVKQLLKDSGLLMPTVQMLARRSRVASDFAYLSGAAHPSAYEFNYDMLTMMQMANAITINNIPPMVKLRGLSDSFDQESRQHFDSGNERLFTTPASIARVWKEFDHSKWLRVSAEESFDLNGHPLSYHWIVLRGDPKHVRIIPENTEQSVVRIEFDYQPDSLIDGSEHLTNMIAIGAFAHNSHYYSAPAFVTVVKLPEDRVYDEGRLLRIDQRDEYTIHPSIARRKDWRADVFVDDPSNPGGWIRDDLFEFTRLGHLVVQRTDDRIEQVQQVQYPLRDAGDHQRVRWQAFGDPFPYDDQPPEVILTQPKEGAIVSGLVRLEAEANDDQAVFFVGFYVDDTFIGESATAPYFAFWPAYNYPDGNYHLTARAYDRYGNTTISKPVRVIVAN